MLASIDGICNGWAIAVASRVRQRKILFCDTIARNSYTSMELTAWNVGHRWVVVVVVLCRAERGDMLCMHSRRTARSSDKEATKGSLFSQSEIMKHSARQMKRASRIIL